MNQTDPSARTEPEAAVETARTVARSGREYISKAAPSLRRGVESGAVMATIGGAGLLSGIRAFLAGKRTLGFARLALGVGFLTAALVQRRSHNRSGESDVEETDVGDTGPDVDAIADEAGGAGEEGHATSETAVEIADTSPDIEDVDSVLESDAEPASIDQREIADTGVDSEDIAEAVERETGDAGGEEGTSNETSAEEGTDVGDATETENIDRLGKAAFDRQSREVPAPQQAFNRGFLAHSSMVCWGIRARDDAVLVAQDYDAIEGRDGVTYIASSEIGTDVRELPIPDTVLTHWDEVISGGMAVTGGDDILFVTTESLATDGLLRVLPAEWADGLSE